MMDFFTQVDFGTKPSYWKPLYPPVKEKLGELLVRDEGAFRAGLCRYYWRRVTRQRGRREFERIYRNLYQKGEEIFNGLFSIQVSLTYHPAKNELTIAILKAKNLKAKDINGKSGK